jgi:hypothetical protein
MTCTSAAWPFPQFHDYLGGFGPQWSLTPRGRAALESDDLLAIDDAMFVHAARENAGELPVAINSTEPLERVCGKWIHEIALPDE